MRFRNSDFTKISNVSSSILKPIFKKFGIHETKLFDKWDFIIGEKLRNKVVPFKISSNNNNNSPKNILHVICFDSATALILNFQKSIILENIAIIIGKTFIDDIKIIQNPILAEITDLEDQEINNPRINNLIDLSDIKDDELKSKLQSIANQIRD